MLCRLRLTRTWSRRLWTLSNTSLKYVLTKTFLNFSLSFLHLLFLNTNTLGRFENLFGIITPSVDLCFWALNVGVPAIFSIHSLRGVCRLHSFVQSLVKLFSIPRLPEVLEWRKLRCATFPWCSWSMTSWSMWSLSGWHKVDVTNSRTTDSTCRIGCSHLLRSGAICKSSQCLLRHCFVRMLHSS